MSGITHALATVRKMDIDPLWLLRLFTAAPILLIVTGGAGVLWTYFFVLSLLPNHVAQVDLPGLASEVRVVRDGKGAPSILCANESDGAVTLGYVTAQDRLWQMDYLRRAARGRLAEIMGPAYTDSDHLMRMVIGERVIGADLRRLSERTRAYADHYVRGVNLFIKRVAHKAPLEFSLLEYAPRPFTVEDSIAILAAFAWTGSPAGVVDPGFASIVGKQGFEKASLCLPQGSSDPSAFPSSILKGWVPTGPLFDRYHPLADPVAFPGPRSGCCWARLSEGDRQPWASAGLIMYQRLQAPAFWYQARLVVNDRFIAGAYIPGTPVPFAGHNGRLAWGCVPAPADDADLFIEHVDGDSPKKYWRDGSWRPLQESVEAYQVKQRAGVTRAIHSTEHGPLISNVRDGYAMSLRWTGRDGLNLLPVLFALRDASNRDEAREALRNLIGPPMQVVWAAIDGTAGIQFAGRVPIRAPGSDGITPAAGWTGVSDWRGGIPFDELPELRATRDAPAAASDGPAGGPDYPMFTGLYWNSEGRTERLKAALSGGDASGANAFREVWSDNVSPLAGELVPLLMGARAVTAEGNDLEEKAFKILTSWDLKTGKGSPGAAVFHLWVRSMMESVFRDELGEESFERFAQYAPLSSKRLPSFLKRRDRQDKDPAQLARHCFSEAVKAGRGLMGPDPAKWKWGALHQAVFRHPLAGKSSFIGLMCKEGPYPAAGAQDTVDMAGWDPARPFNVVEGASLRMGWLMNDPPESVAVVPLGASAHFFSSHYKDQLPAWLNGRMFMDPRDAQAAARSASTTVTFSPAVGGNGAVSKDGA